MSYLPYLSLLAFPISLLALGIALERRRWVSRCMAAADRVIRIQRQIIASGDRS